MHRKCASRTRASPATWQSTSCRHASSRSASSVTALSWRRTLTSRVWSICEPTRSSTRTRRATSSGAMWSRRAHTDSSSTSRSRPTSRRKSSEDKARRGQYETRTDLRQDEDSRRWLDMSLEHFPIHFDENDVAVACALSRNIYLHNVKFISIALQKENSRNRLGLSRIQVARSGRVPFIVAHGPSTVWVTFGGTLVLRELIKAFQHDPHKAASRMKQRGLATVLLSFTIQRFLHSERMGSKVFFVGHSIESSTRVAVHPKSLLALSSVPRTIAVLPMLLIVVHSCEEPVAHERAQV